MHTTIRDEDDLWLLTGCHVAFQNQTYTKCLCDHLTSFALIMDVHNIGVSWKNVRINRPTLLT